MEPKTEHSHAAERTREMHDRYRASGLSLTILIVTITGAAINVIRPQGWLAFVLAMPIVLAILHQTCLYMGQRHEARASWQMLSANMQADHINSIKDGVAGVKERLEAMEKHYLKPLEHGMKHISNSVRWFSWADDICCAAVVSFIVCGAIAIYNIPPAIRHP